jgi:hypothetical protein
MPPLSDLPLEYSNFGRVLISIQQEIIGLALPQLPNEKITINKIAWLDPERVQPPYCTIVPRPEIGNWQDGTNERDDPVYSSQISLIFANAMDVSDLGMGLQLYWRQQIRQLFHNRNAAAFGSSLTLEAGHSFLRSYCEPGEIYLEAAKRLQYDAQYLVVRHLIREARPA